MKIENLLSLVLMVLFLSVFHSPAAKADKSNEPAQIAAMSKADTAAQDEDIPENMKYYKERYEIKYKEPFDVVWKAVKRSVNDISCLLVQDQESQNEQGFYQGVIKTDNCVLAQGKDTSMEVLDRYSLDRPRIMAGVWINGRCQYRFVVREQDDGTTNLLLKTELSGFEEYVTYEVHFWKSNGILEHQMLLDIDKNIAKVKSEK